MESFLGLDLTRNYSFFTVHLHHPTINPQAYSLQVPAAFLVISLPHAYTITVGAKGTFDRCSPRSHKNNIENCSHLDNAVGCIYPMFSLDSPLY